MNKIKIETAVPNYLSVYANYVNMEKMIPDIRDGLIQSLRRFLLTLHLEASDSYKTTAAMQGYNMLHFHPHAAQKSTPVTLVKQKFALGKGQWDDTPIGIPTDDARDSGAADPRYTAIKAHPIVEKMAFKYVRAVDWEVVDLDPEPLAIPTLFPFCLIGQYGMSQMGYGLKTEIPTYEKSDLYNRLQYLLKNTKTKPTIEPKIFGCKIKAGQNAELEKLLTTGQAKIDIQGDYRISNIKNTITIKGWPPGISWSSILNKINKYENYELLDKDEIAYIDESTIETGTAIKFYVTKQRSVADTFEKMKNAIDSALNSSISYTIYAVDNRVVKNVGVDEMLMKCYDYYINAFKQHRVNLISKLNDKIHESNIIIDIRPHLPHCINKNLSNTDSIKYLTSKVKHSDSDITSVLDKYNIRRLLNVNIDVNSYKSEIVTIQTEIGQAAQIIKGEYADVI